MRGVLRAVLFTLLIGPLASWSKQLPRIQPGFYTLHAYSAEEGIHPEVLAEPFGEIVYLHSVEIPISPLDTVPKIRGYGLNGARIKPNPDSLISHRWKDQKWFSRDNSGVIEFSWKHTDHQQVCAVLYERGVRGRTVCFKFQAKRSKVTETQYIGHRGSSYFPPYNRESPFAANTLPALEYALQTGLQGIEVDVQLTQDQRFVVSHDQNLRAATDCSGTLSDWNLDHLTRNCTVLKSTLMPEKMGIRAKIPAMIPSLRMVLEEYLDDSRAEVIVLDIKPGPIEIIVDALRMATQDLLTEENQRKLLFVCRDASILEQIKKFAPKTKLALEGSIGIESFLSKKKFDNPWTPVGGAVHNVLSLNIGLLLPSPINVNRDFIHRAQDKGYEVMGWTVSDTVMLNDYQNKVPELDYLLTDAPYSRIIRLELREMRKNPELIPGR